MATFKVSYSADMFIEVKAESHDEAIQLASSTPIADWFAVCTPLIVQQLNKEVN
jgi:hypothetical protein